MAKNGLDNTRDSIQRGGGEREETSTMSNTARGHRANFYLVSKKGTQSLWEKGLEQSRRKNSMRKGKEKYWGVFTLPLD